MNIGHDLMRRFGPRREPLRDEHPRPRGVDWVLAAFLLAIGGAAVAGLAVAGFRSAAGARVAVPLCLTYVGGYALYSLIRWLVTPGFDQTSIDAGDMFDRGFLRRRRYGGPPVQVALAVLAAAALWVALAVVRHHR
ncbi:MAG: hypothetical protein ACKOEL_09805 [Planctomycetota bacterium]